MQGKNKPVTVEYTTAEFRNIEPHLKKLGWGRTNINKPYNILIQPYRVTYLYPTDLTILRLKYNA